MVDRSALLPSNATALETAISESMDRTPEIGPGIVALRGFKHNPSDRIVPFLVVEYGLQEIADFIPDLRLLLSRGIAWQRIVGTPAAVHTALRWLNYDGDIEEAQYDDAKWWQFQVHLPFEVRNTDFVKPVTTLVKASKPLRSDFVRLTAGWDVRAFQLDTHQLDGGAFLDDWSGIRRSPDEPVLSLRTHLRPRVPYWPQNAISVRTAMRLIMPYRVKFELPLRQHFASFTGTATRLTRLGEPAIQRFQNARFVHAPFGAPPIRAHIGFQ